MTQSPVIRNLEQYCSWMREQKLWTNPDYVPRDIDRPRRFPFIIVVCWSERGREGFVTHWVELEEFGEDVVAEWLNSRKGENEG